MRGKVGLLLLLRSRSWITPAYAGKSFIVRCSALEVKDHPRICGEKWMWACTSFPLSGSPPHMRGKGGMLSYPVPASRITPAYAGKRPSLRLPHVWPRDHPRICGEKLEPSAHVAALPGSPPHMRGKGRQANALAFGIGITPAYAGKRLKRSRSTVPPVAIVPLFPSVCNKPVVSDGSPAGRDAPLFLPAENAVPASPAYNLRSL